MHCSSRQRKKARKKMVSAKRKENNGLWLGERLALGVN